MTVEKKPVPLYAQIRDYIIDGIESGRWAGGAKLPSENELAEQFQVSRITIKKALDQLVEEGAVYRIQGKGTFVSVDGRPVLYTSSKEQERKSFIAVLLPRVDDRYTSNLLKAIEAALDEAGYQLLLRSTHGSPERETRLLREAVEFGVAGVIVYPAEGEHYNEEILRLTLSSFPIIVIDRHLKGVETHCVGSDHEQGSYEAAMHLLTLGHRTIAFVSGPVEGTTSLEERKAGYERALSEHRVPWGSGKMLLDPSEAAIRAFLADNPDVTGIVASHYGIGLLAMRIAQQLGRRIPDKLSFVFFDDYPFSEMSAIPPTCVVQQEEEIGAQAAALLLKVIADPHTSRQRLRLPTQLVVRSSAARCLPFPD